LFLVRRRTPAAIDDELHTVGGGIGCSPAYCTEETRIEIGYGRNLVIEDRRAVRDGAARLAQRTAVLAGKDIDG
jgi:hypothetical protein